VNGGTPSLRRPPRRRSRRQNAWLRSVAVVVLVLLVFALGVALGQALNDSPPPPSTATYVRTLEPLPQQPGTTTTP